MKGLHSLPDTDYGDSSHVTSESTSQVVTECVSSSGNLFPFRASRTNYPAFFESSRICKHERLGSDIGIRVGAAIQTNRITLHIPPSLRLIVPEVVVGESGFAVGVLTREPERQAEQAEVPIRVLIGRGLAKGRRVPAPHQLPGGRVLHRPRRVQMIRVQVPEHIGRRPGPAGDHRHRDVPQPHIFPDQGARGLVFPEQVAGFVIAEDGARAIDRLPDPLPEGIVGVAGTGATRTRARQAPGAVVAVALTAVAVCYLDVEPLGSFFPHIPLPLELLLQSFARLPA